MTNYEYISDAEAVTQAIKIAKAGGFTISHSTARTVSSWFQDSSNVSFVTTGAIYDTVEAMMYDFMNGLGENEILLNRTELNALEAYLFEREALGHIGPVPGWSGMWVDKTSNFEYDLEEC